MPVVVTLIGVGDDGVGVPAAPVMMPAGALARLVWLKLNVPPAPPCVTFCTFTVGVLAFVNVQVTVSPAPTVMEAVPLATLPPVVQLTLLCVHPLGSAASLTVYTVAPGVT
ncbi:hypothetical protein D3C71_1598230 [compost metagenome]